MPTQVFVSADRLSGFVQGLARVPRFSLLIELPDRAGFVKDLDAIATWANAQFPLPKDAKVKPEAPLFRRIKNVEAGYEIALSPTYWPLPAGYRPSIIVGEKFAAFGTSPDVARKALREEGELGEALNRALATLPGNLTILSVSDTRNSAVPELLANVPSLIQWWGFMIQGVSVTQTASVTPARATATVDVPPPNDDAVAPAAAAVPDAIREPEATPAIQPDAVPDAVPAPAVARAPLVAPAPASGPAPARVVAPAPPIAPAPVFAPGPPSPIAPAPAVAPARVFVSAPPIAPAPAVAPTIGQAPALSPAPEIKPAPTVAPAPVAEPEITPAVPTTLASPLAAIPTLTFRLRLDPDEIPTPEEIRPYLFPATYAMSVDAQGFRITSRESFPSLEPGQPGAAGGLGGPPDLPAACARSPRRSGFRRTSRRSGRRSLLTRRRKATSRPRRPSTRTASLC